MIRQSCIQRNSTHFLHTCRTEGASFGLYIIRYNREHPGTRPSVVDRHVWRVSSTALVRSSGVRHYRSLYQFKKECFSRIRRQEPPPRQTLDWRPGREGATYSVGRTRAVCSCRTLICCAVCRYLRSLLMSCGSWWLEGGARIR